MNTVENSSKDRVRQETAAEILELGEMLFDTCAGYLGHPFKNSGFSAE